QKKDKKDRFYGLM
uniref:Tachykinin-like peptide-XIII n=1 Tax=Phoneutria nigriventer TaxID=6918 RepID=TLP13_PHONI|nr:RecName: Full=Tachykinin-like peptide-XIII; AltName: Full=P.nigriventer tachykinin peptides XIII; Short=PnTkP-XIII; AltName: Full=U29-ctenitoxin-Pn1m; Short=U29-CNTX-Pn1m [Phoneutria nigriventer]